MSQPPDFLAKVVDIERCWELRLRAEQTFGRFFMGVALCLGLALGLIIGIEVTQAELGECP